VRLITLIGGALALVTISDAFMYLIIQRRTSLGPEWFPLLFLGTALTYLILAVPIGELADRVGRGRVFLAGHTALLAAYLLLVFSSLSMPVVLSVLTLLGTYYACTDGVLMALASTAVPEGLRASGLALVTTATAVGRFGSSLVFGALWLTLDGQPAVFAFAITLMLVLPICATALRRVDRDAA
jgi:MFS family permease